jgi:hypothetical protein
MRLEAVQVEQHNCVEEKAYITMAIIVNIIVGYAFIALVKDMKDFAQMDVLTGSKASSVNQQVHYVLLFNAGF